MEKCNLTQVPCRKAIMDVVQANKDRKSLHLDILTITFGASTLMWLIDCIFTAAKGEPFLSFDDPTDGWIALAAFVGAIFFWIVLSFILNNNKRVETK